MKRNKFSKELLSETAVKVLDKRYVAKDQFGKPIESYEDMFERIVSIASDQEKIGTEREFWHSQFRNMIYDLDFLPNSPTIMNAKRPLGQLSACFVLPIEDSMEGIFDAIKYAAMIHKSGGGTGFSFSRLRPKDSVVLSTGGVASGPISFMKVFNAATEAVKQGGTRRGANMGLLRVDHPDILEFITCKQKTDAINNFNISVGITDEFMVALEEGKYYNLYNPKDREEIVGEMDAKEVFDLIVESAYNNGEPGIIFIDVMNKDNPIPDEGEIEAPNPCIVGDTIIQTIYGEQKIKDLVGKEIDVYCISDKEKLTIRRAINIRKTKENAELLKIKTTKGELICTPNHKIYTKNRGYIKAKELNLKDKLLFLYKRTRNGRKGLKVKLNGNKFRWETESRFIMKHYFSIKGKDVHHKDENPFNNDFDNLQVLIHGEHSKITCDSMKDKGITFFEPTRTNCRDYYNNKYGGNGINFRILSIEKLKYTEDVYNMEVEEYHNYIANGIVVKNCGEQPLLPYEACNLGSINLGNFVRDNGSINYEKLSMIVHDAVRYLDNIIDANKYPIDIITEKVQRTRKIGLGVMGWADMLIKLKIPYNSEKAVKLAEEIMRFINVEAETASKEIGKEKGEAPCFNDSMISLRNSNRTTIAPTGTLSIIANCSSGVEPLFGLVIFRDQAGMQMTDISELFLEELEKINFNKDLIPEVINHLKKHGTLRGCELVPDEIKEVFVVTNDIATEWHIKMQAAFQKYTNSAVSKTVNMPNSATKEDVREAYLLAYKLGCKGTTVYRDGSRGNVLSSTEKPSEEIKQTEPEERMTTPRPTSLTGFTEKHKIGCGSLYITVNEDDEGNTCEVFINNERGGGCSSQSEATAKLVSIALRSGVSIDAIIDQLKGIVCKSCVRKEGMNALSCPDALAKSLTKAKNEEEDFKGFCLPTVEQVVKNMASAMAAMQFPSIKSMIKRASDHEQFEVSMAATGYTCLECGKPMTPDSGCYTCLNCGNSKCG